MLSYESFFLIILISIIGPVIGLFGLIFYNMLERQVYLLLVENRQILLEKELETSRYMQLNHQIQPHFLFNALNSIYGLIRLKKYESLTKSFEHLVLYIRSKYQEKDFLYPLEKEISHTTHFLVIQKLRFGERLRIDWEIDSEIQQALVIPYLLQSLAENAFKHGIEMIEEEAIIEISIKKHTERQIQLRVKDNGPGFLKDPLSSVQNGVGLINIKRRLDLLFAEEAQISFEFGEGGCVIVKWPLIFDMEVYGYERSTVR